MARIEIIEPDKASGRLKEVYDQLQSSRGKLAEVHKIQSLRPESILKHMDLYMEIMYSKSELSRAQREMIAVIVSINNRCAYCATHHSQALNHYWKDEVRTKQLALDFGLCGLSDMEIELCEFAKLLTIEPNSTGDVNIERLKAKGLSDSAILDATLVVAYFNFVNRMVLGLGVRLETDNGGGYKY